MNAKDFDVPDDYTTARTKDAAEDRIGPFFRRSAFGGDSDGNLETAMRATAAHCNGMGVVHGGVLMTFADYTMSEAAVVSGEENEHCLTVSFDAQFIAGGLQGELLQGEAQVIRRTRSLAFVRGLVFTIRDGTRVDLLAFSGVGKRVLERG